MRLHSAERVVAEVEDILRQFPGINLIPIWDDLFVADRPRLRRIVALLEERRLTRRVSFSCNVRANLVSDELCSLLKRCNVTEASFGAESGSGCILKVLKSGMTAAQNQRALDLLSASGIRCNCSFILGTPGETEEDVEATYEFILRNYREDKLIGYELTILTPMPETEVWRWAVAQEVVGADMDWPRLRFLGSKSHNLESLAQWVELRRRNRSVYLNEALLPQARLFELLLAHHEESSRSSPRAEVVQLVPGGARRVLDVGCAAGAVGKALKDRGVPTAVGVELDRAVAEIAATYLDEVVVGDVEALELPFPEGYFDCVILADVLEHLRDPWSAVKKLAWYLCDGGTVVCSVPNIRNLGVIESLIEGRWAHTSQGIPDRTHLHFFTLAEFGKLLTDGGLNASRVLTVRDPRLSFSGDGFGQNSLFDLDLGRFIVKRGSKEELDELVAARFLIVANKVPVAATEDGFGRGASRAVAASSSSRQRGV